MTECPWQTDRQTDRQAGRPDRFALQTGRQAGRTDAQVGSWYIVCLYGVTLQVEQKLLGSLTGGQGSRPRDDAATTVVNGKSLPIPSVCEMREVPNGRCGAWQP